MKEISASFLCKSSPKQMIKSFNNSTCDYIHFDVMDGIFTKEKFLTPKELTDYLSISKKKNDVHLMVNDPSKYIDKMALYDISYVTVHYEIKELDEALEKIKSFGFKCGISIKPETEIEKIYPFLNIVDLVLIMSVNPGSSGQDFIPSTKNKIDSLKEKIEKDKLNIKIEVDGGVNADTKYYLDNADILVSGSFIQKDIKNIELLR